MPKTVSATEARIHLGALLRDIAEQGETIIVERGGKPQAVRMGFRSQVLGARGWGRSWGAGAGG